MLNHDDLKNLVRMLARLKQRYSAEVSCISFVCCYCYC